MEIIYISTLSSQRVIDEIYNLTSSNPGFAAQKFNRLVAKGLFDNGCSVKALSNPPISQKDYRKIKQILQSEIEDGIQYTYIPFINCSILKSICVFIYSFLYVIFCGFKSRSEKRIICDALSVGASMGALLASKIIKIKSTAIVTDIYGLMVGSNSYKEKVASKLFSSYVTSFDSYVLLTEHMNDLVNPHRKPYIIIEALCEANSMKGKQSDIKKEIPRTIIYAGGVHEKYGLRMLAEAFLYANISDAILVYYGSGPYVEDYCRLCAQYPNLVYAGVVHNQDVVIAECKATLLVNPRFTTEEFAKYSFPSKNMEYMVSGTPLLTTKLPGMPAEYNKYVYLFSEETVEGYARTIKEIMSLDMEELEALGQSARNFVLKEKNNIIQAQRIIELIK